MSSYETSIEQTVMKENIVTSDDGAAATDEMREHNVRDDLPITVYTPESQLRNPVEFLRSMFRDLLASRELAWRLFLRDTRARYRNSLLGYVWVFIPPLAAALPFIFLKSQGVIKMAETPLPYGAYAMIGTIIWQIFVDALNSPLQATSGAMGMMTRINFPRESIFLSGLMQVGLSFAVRFLLLVLVFIWYGIIPPFTAIFFPVGMLALVLTGLVTGLLLTPLSLLYGDVQRLLIFIVPAWMLLTPVLYPVPQTGLAGIVVAMNPLTPLVTSTRNWLTLGMTSNLGGFITVTALMMILLVLAWMVYRVALPHIIARLGN
jgi:lipopolysaccharide transport system permease protein